MRDLIVSVAIVAVLVVSWLFFDSYSDKTVSSVSATIRNEIIPAVEAEHWDLSRLMSGGTLGPVAGLPGDVALIFISSEELLEIDQCMAKAIKYIEAEDVSNSSGELNALAEQLDFLVAREKDKSGKYFLI